MGSILAQPKRVALLAFLRLARDGAPVPRGHVLETFWPDLTEERALSALRQSVHFLRRSLGAHAVERTGDHLLHVPPATLWCDAHELPRLLEKGRGEEALELYRGPFLEGLPLDGSRELEDWVDRTRRRLRDLAVVASSEEGERALAEGRPRDAVAHAEALQSLDALDERGASLLVRAHTDIWGSRERAAGVRRLRVAARARDRRIAVTDSYRTGVGLTRRAVSVRVRFATGRGRAGLPRARSRGVAAVDGGDRFGWGDGARTRLDCGTVPSHRGPEVVGAPGRSRGGHAGRRRSGRCAAARRGAHRGRRRPPVGGRPVGRGAPVPEPEPGHRERVLRGRHPREPAREPLANRIDPRRGAAGRRALRRHGPLSLGHRGAAGGDGAHAGERPAGGRSDPPHRRAERPADRRPDLGGQLRPPGSTTCSACRATSPGGWPSRSRRS